jgi:hypothetical protein
LDKIYGYNIIVLCAEQISAKETGNLPALPVSDEKSHTPCGSPRWTAGRGLLIPRSPIFAQFSENGGMTGGLGLNIARMTGQTIDFSF